MNIKCKVIDPLNWASDAIVSPVMKRYKEDGTSSICGYVVKHAEKGLEEFCRNNLGMNSPMERCCTTASFGLRGFKKIINIYWENDLAVVCGEESRFFTTILQQASDAGCKTVVFPFGWYPEYEKGFCDVGECSGGTVAELYRASKLFANMKLRIACRDSEQVLRVERMLRNVVLYETDAFRGLNFSFCGDSIGESHNLIDRSVDIISAIYYAETPVPTHVHELLKKRYWWMKDMVNKAVARDDRASSLRVDEGGARVLLDTADTRLEIPSSALQDSDDVVRRLFDISNLGQDLPVWFSPLGGGCRKRVMIVAQDPLRAGQRAGMMTVSTPFGIHSLKMRSRPGASRGIVHKIVANLISEGCAVWLTDYAKLYAYTDVMGGSDIRKNPIRNNEALSSRFTNAFNREVAMFDPDVILVLGLDPARELCGATGCACQTIPHAVDSYSYVYVSSDGSVRKEIPCRIAAHPSRITSRREELVAAKAMKSTLESRGTTNDYVSYYLSGLV